MPYTKNLDYRYHTNSRISPRLRQILVLVATVIIGMLISASVNAIPSKPSVVVTKTVSASLETKK